MTGSPFNQKLINHEEEWNAIPGACGCTSQVCGYRDTLTRFNEIGVMVYGLSNNSSDYQVEAAKRLEIEYELLSDENMKFANSLRLPTFRWQDLQLLKRVTLIFKNNKVVKVFYPIFPPSKDSGEVFKWLLKNR